MFRNFDYPKVKYVAEGFTELNLMDFLLVHSVPPLIEYHDRLLHHVVGAKSAGVVLFLKRDNYMNSDYFLAF